MKKAVAVVKDTAPMTPQVEELKDAVFTKFPLADITIATRPGPGEDKTLHFVNARTYQGFDKQSMEELEVWIAEKGLLNPLSVRYIPGTTTPQLIAGERRIRAIHSLVDKNCDVWNPETRSNQPASVVYKTVDCRFIADCDDEEATSINHMENDQSVPLSEGEVVAQCERLESMGYSRKEIGERFLKKSVAWLSHTLNFRKRLTEEEFDQLRSGEFTRSFAIGLMKLDNGEKREKVKEAAIIIAKSRREEFVEKCEAEAAEAEVTLDLAEAQVAVAEFTGDTKKVEQATKVIKRARQKSTTARAKKDEAKQAPVTLQSSDLEEGAHAVGVTIECKTLTGKTLRSAWIDPAKDLLKKKVIKDPITHKEIPRQHLELTLAVATAIDEGKRDPLGVLRSFYTESGVWGEPIPIPISMTRHLSAADEIEDDELDDEEDIDDDDDDLIDDLDLGDEEIDIEDEGILDDDEDDDL